MMLSGVSIIVPVFNEASNIIRLQKEIHDVMSNERSVFEIIIVDDGSTDETWQTLATLDLPDTRLVRLARNFGQSTAIQAGIDASLFDTIVTIDGDLQNDPRDIPMLLQKLNEKTKVVLGYRIVRRDKKFSRVLPSKIANLIVRRISGVDVKDLGCTLRAFRKTSLGNLRLMGEMHRLLSLYLITELNNAAEKVVQVPVNHRRRIAGLSKYGLSRSVKVFADLMLFYSLRKFGSKPLYFFGGLALIASSISLTTLVIEVCLRVLFDNPVDPNIFISAVIGALLGALFLALGLVAELVVRQMIASDRDNHYYTLAEPQ